MAYPELYNVDILNYKGLPSDFPKLTLFLAFQLLPSLMIIFFSSEVRIFYTMPVVFWGLGYGILLLIFSLIGHGTIGFYIFWEDF